LRLLIIYKYHKYRAITDAILYVASNQAYDFIQVKEMLAKDPAE
jgi:hypothetical protein